MRPSCVTLCSQVPLFFLMMGVVLFAGVRPHTEKAHPG